MLKVLVLPQFYTAVWTTYFYLIRRHGMHTQNILPQNGGAASWPSILFCHWIEPESCTWLVGPVFAFENSLSPCPAVTMHPSSGYWSPRVSLTCCTNRRATLHWRSLLFHSASSDRGGNMGAGHHLDQIETQMTDRDSQRVTVRWRTETEILNEWGSDKKFN